MYRVHRILPAIAFALCVMLAAASSAVPRFYLCNEATCDACKPVEGATLLDADILAEVTRKLCAWTDTDLCGWQLELKGLPAGAGAPLQIEAFSPSDGTCALGPIVCNPVPGEASPAGSLSLNWVYDGTSLFEDEDTQFLGTLALKGGETHSSLAVSAKSLAVGCDAAGKLEQIAIDPGTLFVPEPPRLLLLAAGLALLAGLAAGRRNSGLAALLLLVIAGGSPAARADVLAASRGLRNADLDLVSHSSLGTAMAGMGDLNGDGVEDLAVGLPDADGGRGRVQIALLRSDGSVDAVVPVGEGLAGFAGPLPPGSAFGTAVASAGDLNGDGIDELAVAAPGSAPGSRRLWLLFLQRGGPVGPPLFVSNAVEIDTTHETHALAGLGDVDGDTVPDLALGHPFYGDGACSECGAVSILRFFADGNTKPSTLLSTATPGFPPLAPHDHFGAALGGLRDLDANSVPDLAVGMPGHAGGEGRVVILFLDFPNPPGTDVVALGFARLDGGTVGFPLSPLAASDAFGSSIAVLGDLDSNSVEDLAVGVPGLAGERGGVVVLTLTAGGALIGPGAVIEESLGTPPDAFTPAGSFGRALASLDVDGDGDREMVAGAARDEPITSEGIAWFLHFADPDGDGRPDAFADNCAGTRNPSQADTDADGFGDACDNCVDFDNGPRAGTCTGGGVGTLALSCSESADCDGCTSLDGCCSIAQEDADADGVGDVCEGVVVRLKGPSLTPSLPTPLKSWELSIDCGRHQVEELAVLFFQPDISLPLPLHFAGTPGCGAPTAFGGSGCGLPAMPGLTVSDASGVFTSDASGVFAAGGIGGLRPNALYAFLYGNPSTGAALCLPFEEDVLLGELNETVGSGISDLYVAAGQLELAPAPSGSGPGSDASLVADGSALPGFCISDDPADSVPAPALRSAFAAASDPTIFIDATLAADQEVPGYQAWEICFQSDRYLRRIRLGIGPPEVSNGSTAVFTRDDLEWMGCESAAAGGDWKDCTYTLGDEFVPDGETLLFRYPIDVADLDTRVFFPDPLSGTDDGRGDRLYPVLEGVRPGFADSNRRLNANTIDDFDSRWHCVGQVLIEGGSSASEHPILYFQGETYLDGLEKFCPDVPGDNKDCSNTSNTNTFDAFDPDVSGQYYGCTKPTDNDGDGVRFEMDNCRYTKNPLQLDSGKLEAKAPGGRDSVGDACQCGEGDGDGIISGTASALVSGEDLQNLRKHLVGGSPDGFDIERCGVLDAAGESPTCNILDAVELQRALTEGAGETLSLECDAYNSSE